MWLNVGCGPHRAPAPWWNVDTFTNDQTHPDQVVDPDRLPFVDRFCELVYLGHVLEHVRWEQVPAFLAEVRRVLQPGGRLCVVGPDCDRVLHRWRDGLEPWEQVRICLEWGESFQPHTGERPGARHQWNCTEARVVDALTAAGLTDVAPHPVASLTGWPVVSFVPTQCAVTASEPKERLT